MKIAVWIVSVVLTVYCLMVGVSKVAAPMEVLQSMTNGIPVVLLKIAGFAEIIGAIGLIVPAATRILPILTPIAAAGVSLTMLGRDDRQLRHRHPGDHRGRRSSPACSRRSSPGPGSPGRPRSPRGRRHRRCRRPEAAAGLGSRYDTDRRRPP